MNFFDTIDFVLRCIKETSAYKNNEQLFINSFSKEKGITVNAKFAEDLYDYDYRMEKILQWEDPLPDPHIVLDDIAKLIKYNQSSYEYEELRMMILKIVNNILNRKYEEQTYLNRHDIISKVNLGDITLLIKRYDSYFEGRTVCSLPEQSNHGSCTISAICGNRIAVCHEGNIQITIWNDKKIESILKVGNHSKNIITLPNDRILVISSKEVSSIWNLRTSQKEDFEVQSSNVGIFPDGRLIIPGSDCQFKIWNPETQATEESFGSEVYQLPMLIIKILQTKIAIFTIEGIEIWDRKTKNKEQTIEGGEIINLFHLQMEVLPDDHLLIIDYTDIKIWNLKNHKIILSYRGGRNITAFLLVDQILIVAYADFECRVINLKTTQAQKRTFNIGEIKYIKQIGSEILLGGEYGTLCIWDPETDQVRSNFDTYPKFCNLEVFDGGVVISLPGEQIKILR